MEITQLAILYLSTDVLNIEHPKAQKQASSPSRIVTDGIVAAVIAGLAIGAGFIFLFGFIGNFPSGFGLSEWHSGIDQNGAQIPVVILERNQIGKYQELERGISFVDNNPSQGPFGGPRYETWIMGYEAGQLMKDFPFVELSHEDQFYRGYYLIIKVINLQENEGQELVAGEEKDHNYLVGIYSVKPGKVLDY